MTEERIAQFFKKHAQTFAAGEPFMSQRRFAAALREALAEEMAEAARLLKPLSETARFADARFPDDMRLDTFGEVGRVFVRLGDCRAAARFVAEHGKNITPPSSPPLVDSGTTPSTSPNA